MWFQISHLFLFVVAAGSSMNVLYAGKYVYDEATRDFKEKSKKQAHRLRIVDKAKAAPNQGRDTDAHKSRDPRWNSFYEKRSATENLDWWLARFEREIVAEIAELQRSSISKERLDYRLRHKILQEKLQAVREELALPKFQRHLWQMTPTAQTERAQVQRYSAKLRLYTSSVTMRLPYIATLWLRT